MGGLAGLARRHFELLIAAAAVALTVIPLVVDGRLSDPGNWLGSSCLVAAAVLLAGWQRFPVPVLLLGPLLILSTVWIGPDPSNFELAILMAYAALAAERFSGRVAWVSSLGYVAYLVVLYVITGDDSPGLIVLTLPGFVAGTALRLRRETAEELAERGRELEAERELFAELSVRNERARIASELHDIVGHALSVMVVQAAAGQRLASRSPDAAAEALSVIAQSARQGREDLQRLIDLLAGTEVTSPDLSLIDEIVNHAARSGLRVTCRLEGDRDGISADAAHAAFRVVQESLTNALRHAPGAEVRVLLRGEPLGRGLTVRVENDSPPAELADDTMDGGKLGGGRGLIGLRERILALGGSFSAGPRSAGGWLVEAHVAR